MTSPARAHFERVAAGAAAPVAAPTPVGVRLLGLLRAHQATLKSIKSLTAKIAAKRTYLPEYAAYVAGLLDAGAVVGPDAELLLTILIWRLDVGDHAGAMDIARVAHPLKLKMPERFARDLPCALLEEIADGTLAGLKAGQEIDAAAQAALDEAMTLTEADDMPDEVRAKAHKARGLTLRAAAPDDALTHLRLALVLDKGCGVKTEITRLEKAARGDDETAPAVPPPSTDAD